MGEVGEELVAERIIAEVLNGAAAIGVGVSFLKLSFSKSGEVFEKNRANGLLPGEVNELLVGLHGVRDSRGAGEKECAKDGGTKKRPA